ncbi:hypothetical protein [Polymorphospora rubra]|uniref:hypothetical protein n=1 Tax=Polymorphospora rubra TaxID=338584 RepID=UPI00340121D5
MTIIDVDRFAGGVLWEEKSADGRDPRIATQAWINKHVIRKFDSYVRARPHLEGHERAPVGLHMTAKDVEPGFKASVNSAVEKWRSENPGVEAQIRWAE